jgi:tetratricopeptide (TPR) repeat protein
VGRYFLKKLTALMNSVEKDLRAERIEPALEKLRKGYKYAPWQLLVKKQIDSQIGSILYLRKRFDEALPYLEKSIARNWSAMCMLAAHHYRHKNYAAAYKVMEKTVLSNKKEAFVYSLYAYFLSEQGHTDKAIQVLTRGHKKLPLDERISGELDSLKNRKKVKIQNYGPLWIQLHLGKSQDGVKSYQALILNQKIKRR